MIKGADWRGTSWSVTFLALAAWIAVGAVTQGVPEVRGFLRDLSERTGWLGLGMLVAHLLTVAVLLFVAVVVGKLRAGDLGLDRDHLFIGLIGALGLWALWQSSLLVHGLAFRGEVQLGPRWTDETVWFAGQMLLAMLAVGFAEELWFRGILLSQLRYKLALAVGQLTAVGVALTATSLMFGAVHLWGAGGRSITEVMLFHSFNGLILGLLFLYSGNLWFVAAAHGLGNWGIGHALFVSSISASTMWTYCKAIVVVVWTVVLAIRWIRTGHLAPGGPAGAV